MSADDSREQPAHERLAQLASQLHTSDPGAADKPASLDARIQAAATPTTETSTTSAAPNPTAISAARIAAPMSPDSPGAAAAPPAANRGTRESQLRAALITYFPMGIAILSLCLSIYQGYLFHRSIDLIERNVARGEYVRTCREIIETYFLVKQKVGVLMPAADRGNVAGASRVTENNRLEAQAAIAKFGGLGTYLANFQDPGTRARYTEMTRTLTGIMEAARNTPLPDIDKLFEPADKIFTSMNDDCVRLARVRM